MHSRAALVLVVLALAAPGCRGRSPDPAPALTAARIDPVLSGGVDARGPTVVARSVTHALATTEDHVYFGDSARDRLFRAPKEGGAPPVEVGAPAPVDIAFGPAYVAWIGARGDLLLQRPPRRAPPTRGTFTALAAHGENLYVTEADVGGAGTLFGVNADGTMRRIARFDSRPHDLGVDDRNAYVVTDDDVRRVPREGGAADVLAGGRKLTGIALDAKALFVTTALPKTRGLLRVLKAGGEATVIATGVRNGAITTWNGDVYFFDADTPTLQRVPASGGDSTVVARSAELGRAVAVAVDASGIYIAVAHDRAGAILAFGHPL